MAKRPPPRGASRKPASRPQSPHQSPRYGARPRPGQASARSKPAAPSGPRLRRRPLLLGLLLLALIGGLLTFITREPRAPVDMPPAALASPAPTDAARESSQPAAPEPARAVDNLEFYEILPRERILPERQPASTPPPRPQPQATPVPAGSQHWLQVGQFRQEAMAVFRHEKLVNAGLPARVETQQVDGEARFRVLAGPFASMALRQQAREQINGLGLEAIPVNYQGVSP